MKNKILKTLSLVIPLLLLCNSAIYANDTYLGSVGGNAFNENEYDKKFISYTSSNTIQMVKEKIHIIVEKESLYATCKFWFVNTGPKEFTQFGFPKFSFSEANAIGNIRNFTTSINGKEVTVDSVIQVTDYQGIRDSVSWFYWVYDMPINDTVLIENRYSGEVGFMLHGSIATYIIGTGSTWNGPIKEGEIIFDFSKILSSNFIFKDIISNTKIKPAFIGDSVIFSFNNYKPHKDEYLRVDYLSYWHHFKPFAPSFIFKDNKSHGDAVKLMRNEIFARHGYVFKDANLNKYFSSKKWYKPNNNFKTSMLNEHEQGMVNYLSQLEKEINK